MKRLITTIRNIFSIEDLRIRILNTLGFLLVFRLGSYIVLPGIDAKNLQVQTKGLLGLLDIFLGGAFSNASIFALGIMPYISASIVFQLLTVAVPYFQKMQKEGESGRRKINQLTRYLTVLITIFQSAAYISQAVPSEAIVIDKTFFTVSSMIILASGTIFCMWLGERITDKGIGNGISMLIMIGIISRLPGALIAEAASKGMSQALLFVIEIVVLFFIVMGVVMTTQATRKIPIQYAKQMMGKTGVGQRQYIPLKLNSAGVMPIIFAQSLMFLPPLVAQYWPGKSDTAIYIANTFSDFTSWQYNLTFGILIILFTFFYTAIAISPNQIADDLKRNGGFIPGVKPGPNTSEFIDLVLTRITLPGALFLAAIAILPSIASIAGISNRDFAQFYGGTSLLIMVGVILDTLQQIESYLLMRHYEGLMKSGKVKGRENVSIA